MLSRLKNHKKQYIVVVVVVVNSIEIADLRPLAPGTTCVFVDLQYGTSSLLWYANLSVRVAALSLLLRRVCLFSRREKMMLIAASCMHCEQENTGRRGYG